MIVISMILENQRVSSLTYNSMHTNVFANICIKVIRLKISSYRGLISVVSYV